jgi:predicted transcriptional regulator of viral defense system
MKTLGPQTAKLVTKLQDENRTIFTLEDAVRIVGARSNIVSNMLGKAERRGVVTRLRRGTYALVPFELGSETTYAGNPLVVADRLMGDRKHFLSHGTALAVHDMTTQPRLLVTVSAVAPPAAKIVAQGTEIRTVSIAPEEIFGVTEKWIDGRDKVQVSDRERTIVDCLRRQDLCGGYIEADAGAWMQRDNLDAGKLVDYAIRLGVGSVISRTGYLLDSCRIGSDTDRKRLAGLLTKTYHLLDPTLPAGGRYDARWRLRLNLEQSEIEAVRNT